MRQFFFVFVALFFLTPIVSQAQAERTCQTDEYMQLKYEQDPEYEQRVADIERFTEQYIARHQEEVGTRNVITIPTVVHVVYKQNSQNISTAQIQSQIDVLNADFSRMNADASNTPSVFAGVAANTDIQFCLASVDPDGNATSGIQRRKTRKNQFGTNDAMKSASGGGINAWPAGDYLNIWVCNLSGGLLGYAQFPGGAAATDGVVCDYAYFGTIGTATAPFNLGRTATHEVGHWLNLRHIWGDGGCSVDDFVGDTPAAGGPNYTGSPCSFPGANSCNTGAGDLPDMFQNYMDYSDDACMNLFTTGQAARMNAALNGPRASLANSGGCGGGGTGPTCSDGIQNGDETGVDCGGSCPTACPPSTCNAPSGISASFQTVGKKKARINISWSASSSANSYNVYVREVGSSSWSSTNTSGTSVTFSGLSRNTAYEYYVESVCTGATDASSIMMATSPARFADGQAPMSFYPNPAHSNIVIEFGDLQNEYVDIHITDLQGKVVMDMHQVDTWEGFLEVDVSRLSPGVYFIQLYDQEERYMEKMLINSH